MKFQVSGESNDEVFGSLVAGVRAHNFKNMGEEVSVPLSAICRDDDGVLVGGVAGRTIYQQFLIEVVWVHENYRAMGLGRELMALAENEALKRCCLAAQLDTLSFQAPVFYEKLGFEVIGKVEGIPGSPDRFFMLKKYD